MIFLQFRRVVIFFMISAMVLVLSGCNNSDNSIMSNTTPNNTDEAQSYVLTKIERHSLCTFLEPPDYYLCEDILYDYYEDGTLKQETLDIYDFDNQANNQCGNIIYTYENGSQYTKSFDENCDGEDYILTSFYDAVTGFLLKQEFSDIDQTNTVTTNFVCDSDGNITEMEIQFDEENEDETLSVTYTYEEGNLIREDIDNCGNTFINQYNYTDGNLIHEAVELNYNILFNNPNPGLYYPRSFTAFISSYYYEDNRKIKTEIDYYSDEGGPDGNTDLVVFTSYDDNGNVKTEKFYMVTGNDYEIDPDTDAAHMYSDYTWELR